jgi:hypothetical protein
MLDPLLEPVTDRLAVLGSRVVPISCSTIS